jgi:magnesium transporter
MLKVYSYDIKKSVYKTSDSFNPEEGLLANHDRINWIDICAPEEAEYKVLESINNFHPLTIEDCRHFSLFPKMDEYEDYIFLVFHDVGLEITDKLRKISENEKCDLIRKCYDEDFDSLDIKTFELDIFITKNTVITVHQREVKAISKVMDSIAGGKDYFKRGRDFLLHKILDGLIDQYLEVAYAWNEAIELLEEDVINESVKNINEKILTLKRNHLMLRRTITHEKDIIIKLMRGGPALGINKRAVVYLQDLHDHISRLQDNIEINREMLATIFEAYLSSVSNKMNRAMVKLSVIATIFMPLTFIAGVYGMNFKYLPEVDWEYGYLYAWALFLVVALISYKYFHKHEMI